MAAGKAVGQNVKMSDRVFGRSTVLRQHALVVALPNGQCNARPYRIFLDTKKNPFLTEMSGSVLLVSFDKMIVLQFRHWLLFPLLVPGSATDSSRVSWRRLWASATGTMSVARFSTEGGFATDSTGWYGRKQASTKQEEKPYKLSNMFADLTVYKCVHCGFTL